ncbi:DUF4453 domain-containing protein [Alphaproteobacteria bacterium KMM 3653]|uniref:DUF4453 domain-containing protein n=1 Tax=Harenicola maris TaxID=2841044 RepID=A0AAP2G9Y2_9RHOB|nr:DUF4453 domain-containing protein [Harenicola maris]
MRFTALVFSFFTAAVPAMAQDRICDDLWFTRNAVFAEAGYCFDSALGQSVFGSECSTKSPELSNEQKALLTRVKAREAEWECKVSTGNRRLAIEMLPLRMALEDMPVMQGFESSCFGWKGAPKALRRGHHAQAARIGTIEPGDGFLTSYELEEGWEFLVIYRDEAVAAMGWADFSTDEWDCEGYAG